jgi:hypothetical protein
MKQILPIILTVICLSASANAEDYKLRCEVKKLERSGTANLNKIVPIVLEQKLVLRNAPAALINKYTTDQSSLPFDLMMGATETNTGIGIRNAQVSTKDGMVFNFSNGLGLPQVITINFGVHEIDYRIVCTILPLSEQ